MWFMLFETVTASSSNQFLVSLMRFVIGIATQFILFFFCLCVSSAVSVTAPAPAPALNQSCRKSFQPQDVTAELGNIICCPDNLFICAFLLIVLFQACSYQSVLMIGIEC